MELTNFEIKLFLKHYRKQDYKSPAAARRIYQVEGEDGVSERVAQRWFQRFGTRVQNTKDLPISGRHKL